MNKSLLIRLIVIAIVFPIAVYAVATPQTISADLKNSKVLLSSATLVSNGHLTICKLDKSSLVVVRKINVVVTAYSSAWDETTGIPGKPGIITASGKHVADGIIANNMLPFGTQVMIPALYGNKIFTVEDRMNAHKGKYQADIWMPTKTDALRFGVKVSKIEIVES